MSVGGNGERWLERATTIFQSIETVLTSPAPRVQAPPPSTRVLRERKPASTVASPRGSPRPPRRMKGKAPLSEEDSSVVSSPSGESVEEVQRQLQSLDLDKNKSDEEDVPAKANGVKKVPRVILRIKEPEGP